MVMTQDVTVTDLFCGAGGSSIGAEKAGARLVMAANHWKLAIETHNSNFPNARHDLADISQVNPRRYPHTDILIASPECTNHSQAKTNKVRATIWEPEGDAEAERSRATMWDVPRFAEFHRYDLVIVENVVEATRWEPFESWLMSMHALGYEHRLVFLNSFVAHPTPQSRDRMYVVFWRKGNTPPDLEFTATAWCERCGENVEAIQSWKSPTRRIGKYRQQYVYRCPRCAEVATPYAWPAAAAIDWSLPAPRIGDRAHPLAAATMARIRAGLERYGSTAIIQAAGHTFERPGYYRTWPTWAPLGTQTGTAQHGVVVDLTYSHAAGHVSPSEDPWPTQSARRSHGLVVNMRGTSDAALAATAQPANSPFGPQTTQVHDGLVIPMHRNGEAQPETWPVGTVEAGGNHHGLLVRNYQGGAEMTSPTDEPARTITAVDHHSLLMPYYGTGQAHPVSDPTGAMTTVARYALVGAQVEVEDCGFRMLEPHEIGRAMAFPDTYNVMGNKRERVRQYGNAVTPPVMDKILARAIASLAPR